MLKDDEKYYHREKFFLVFRNITTKVLSRWSNPECDWRVGRRGDFTVSPMIGSRHVACHLGHRVLCFEIAKTPIYMS